MKNYKINPKHATVYIDDGFGLMVQLPSGDILPGLTDIQVKDGIDSATLCTATFQVNIGEYRVRQPPDLEVESMRREIEELKRAQVKQEHRLVSRIKNLIESNNELKIALKISRDREYFIKQTWWYKLFAI